MEEYIKGPKKDKIILDFKDLNIEMKYKLENKDINISVQYFIYKNSCDKRSYIVKSIP